jgi:hypothetical protein
MRDVRMVHRVLLYLRVELNVDRYTHCNLYRPLRIVAREMKEKFVAILEE